MKRGGPLKRYTALKRKSRLRPQSKKTASIERRAATQRKVWRHKAGRCMVCNHSPHDPNPEYLPMMAKLVAHEISNGGLRLGSLDKPYCILIACRGCNAIKLVNKRLWPEVRQLALLKLKAPERYDLEAYLQHTNPRAPHRITEDEVQAQLVTLA